MRKTIRCKGRFDKIQMYLIHCLSSFERKEKKMKKRSKSQQKWGTRVQTLTKLEFNTSTEFKMVENVNKNEFAMIKL